MVHNQLMDIQEEYLKQMKKYERGQGIDNIPDQFVNSFKKHITNLEALLNLKDSQNQALHTSMSGLKVYARELKLRLERFYKMNNEVMPSHLVREPVSLSDSKTKS